MLRQLNSVITLTDAAADRIKFLLEKCNDPKIKTLRIGIKEGGCAGMTYTLDYAVAAEKLDEIINDKGVTVLIEPKAVMYLLGTEMDYKVEKLGSGFIFNNPNEESACGCGESVNIKPVENIN